SMIERGGCFTLADGDDEWIVKPPHPSHPNVPANEYTLMLLAAAAGIQTPEVKLVKLDDVDLGGLAGLSIPQWETWAYAIKRYDRSNNEDAEGRVHVEDFAQVFNVYGDQEYKATNYDTIGRLIFDLFPNRFEQIAEFVRRLVVNILIGNGDAHLKNWSVIYPDKVTPQLAPAYDLVSTIHYVQNDSLALNLGGEKRFESINEAHFDRLARRMEAPAKFVLETVKETVATARKEWPEVIREIGLPEDLRDRLYGYWGGLSGPLRLRQ
ncbi:MAG: HipA domain-containing protein, partial [Gammaproteobacteria bacterium]|nr:HipA domain-containing protein [Gammaproteobacteria bacterium]